jgi:DeoR/GlpR family transcriptional regulator of sugar metabolism
MKEIVDLLVYRESVSVSEVTARRTLRTMEKDGRIIRTHGGVKLYRKTIDYFFDEKFLLNVEKKKKTGRRTSELVAPNEVVLFGGQVRLFRRDVTGLVVKKNNRLFRARKAFIGADGVTARDGLMATG